jgi:hypothetical protein
MARYSTYWIDDCPYNQERHRRIRMVKLAHKSSNSMSPAFSSFSTNSFFFSPASTIDAALSLALRTMYCKNGNRNVRRIVKPSSRVIGSEHFCSDWVPPFATSLATGKGIVSQDRFCEDIVYIRKHELTTVRRSTIDKERNGRGSVSSYTFKGSLFKKTFDRRMM